MLCDRRTFLGLGAALALTPLGACAPVEEVKRPQDDVQRTLFYFDTVCVIGGMMDESVLDEAERACANYEQLFSRTREGTDVWRINHAAGNPTEVSADTADLIRKSLDYSAASSGLFDVTIGAVTELWDFHEQIVPDPAAIEAALPHVGYEGIHVEGNTVTLSDPEARIDLGGIAKGYVTDRLIELFEASGVESAYVNLGGNVAVLGNKPDGSAWSVGVRDPFDPESNSVIAKVMTSRGSVVTSGLYERSFERDGITYSHILDPRTGYPVDGEVVSATIYSVASIDGDGYTKPLFMYPLDQSLAFLEERGLDGLIVTKDGERHLTAGSAFELM